MDWKGLRLFLRFYDSLWVNIETLEKFKISTRQTWNFFVKILWQWITWCLTIMKLTQIDSKIWQILLSSF